MVSEGLKKKFEVYFGKIINQIEVDGIKKIWFACLKNEILIAYIKN